MSEQWGLVHSVDRFKTHIDQGCWNLCCLNDFYTTVLGLSPEVSRNGCLFENYTCLYRRDCLVISQGSVWKSF